MIHYITSVCKLLTTAVSVIHGTVKALYEKKQTVVPLKREGRDEGVPPIFSIQPERRLPGKGISLQLGTGQDETDARAVLYNDDYTDYKGAHRPRRRPR